MNRITATRGAVLATLALAGATLALAPATHATPQPDALFRLPPFTTAPKSAPGHGRQAELFAVATGCHRSFDRFVVRARFATPAYDVRYVKQITEDPSGRPVRLRGTKRIRVVIRQARAHTQAGSGLLPAVRTPLCPGLRQVKLAGDFEGYVSFGLGLRAKRGFRVFRLTDPTRIVIDTAH
jgi:hypothetical protein